ncbi:MULTISPECIES: hypothetical protein [unclassified Martelella]|uniref:hypothetical protein n=1 Tax=unclassified Martelella TaxID=2629616 RepID=UPI0025C473A1|nr:hypothetical protein [Martelella sp.]
MQVAGGRVTCVLELRDQQASKHWRAYLEKAKVPFEGEQTLMFGGGHMKCIPMKYSLLMMLLRLLNPFMKRSLFLWKSNGAICLMPWA